MKIITFFFKLDVYLWKGMGFYMKKLPNGKSNYEDIAKGGFNISMDITKDIEFNDMLGFTEEEVKYIMNELEIPKEKQEKLLPIIKQNYDGYVFSNAIKANIEDYRMYNSNMTLYFLNYYSRFNEVPEELVDINIISDYSKIASYMNLCKNMEKVGVLEMY